MPRKLFDSEANEVEVPDDTELETLRSQAKESEELKAKLAEAEEAANPNWKEARARLKKLDALEKSGKVLADDGSIGDANEKIDIKRVQEEARNAAKREMLDSVISEKFNSLPENLRDVAKSKFEKLTYGEELSIGNVENYFKEAVKIVTPEKSMAERSFAGSSGSAPLFDKNSDETKQAEQLSKSLGLPTLEDFKK